MPAQVREVMTSPVIVARADTPVDRALQLLSQREIHTLPISDAKGTLSGITCECELAEAWPQDLLRHVASRGIIWIQPEARLGQAAQKLDDCGVGSLLVLEAGLLIGIVTRADLVRAGALLPRECASCGARHALLSAFDDVHFCRSCLEQTRSSGVRKYYFTLGGGD